MKTTQIASEYQALVNIFVEEGMMSYHKSKYKALQTRFVGRVSDNGTDWSLKVNYFNLTLIVRGNGEVAIEDARDGIDKIETPLNVYIEGIKDNAQRQDALYKASLIRTHARVIKRAYTTPAVLNDKIAASKKLFATIKADATKAME